MKVLVTGGLGFIGSALVRRLASTRNYEVHVIDDLSTGSNSRVSMDVHYHYFDICDSIALADLFDRHEFAGVFHLAALPRITPSFTDPIEHHRVNIGGTLSVLERFIQQTSSDCIFVNSSSSSIYGDSESWPTKENSPKNPKSPYALQKYTSEQYVDLLCRYHNRKSISLRYFNPYGPGSYSSENPLNAYSSVIGIWLEAIANHEPLLVYGDGNQRRDFIHVADVAEINYRCFRKAINLQKINHVLNVGTGHSISLNEIIDYLRSFISVAVSYRLKRIGEAQITCSDTTALQEFIGSLHLRDIFSYLKENIDAQG